MAALASARWANPSSRHERALSGSWKASVTTAAESSGDGVEDPDDESVQADATTARRARTTTTPREATDAAVDGWWRRRDMA
jgi:hypothetical protein